MTYPRVCKGCGKPFEATIPDRQYCSRRCYWQTGRVETVCAGCGKPIRLQANLAAQGPKHYCSQACRYAHYAKPKHPVAVVCEHCGKVFEKYPGSHNLQSQHHFCGFECHLAWQKAGNEPIGPGHPNYGSVSVCCANCGAELVREPWQANGYKKQFCNTTCMGEWQSKNLRGPAHPRWKGGRLSYGPNWHHQAEKARKRDRYCCRVCGISQEEAGIRLHVHHIKSLRDFGYIAGQNDRYTQANDLSNLITLCPACHSALSSGHIRLLAPAPSVL